MFIQIKAEDKVIKFENGIKLLNENLIEILKFFHIYKHSFYPNPNFLLNSSNQFKHLESKSTFLTNSIIPYENENFFKNFLTLYKLLIKISIDNIFEDEDLIIY